jgi:hypothetical protein
MIEQNIPNDFENNREELCHYAKTFFGFGSWKAGYWLIGLEERGCTESPDELNSRYLAWEELKKTELVDLRKFFNKCEIPRTPDWRNRTWRALHCVCESAGLQIGELNEHNELWGGAKNLKRNNQQLALIEAMSFPAPSTKPEKWPYSKWNSDYMKSREKCADKFLDCRLGTLAKMFVKHKPKVVITYGRCYTQQHDIRCWIAKICKFQTSSWKSESVKGKGKSSHSSHLFLKEVHWSKNGKSLLVCIAQPASFRGANIPCKLGEKIKGFLAQAGQGGNRVARRRGG